MRKTVGIVTLFVAVPMLAGGCATTPKYSGAELFAANCASCHGRYGEGDGPAAAGLTRRVPDLRYLAARSGGAFPRARVTEIVDGRAMVDAHGERDMPVWGDAFASLEGVNKKAQSRATAKIEAVVDFLAGMQQPGDRPAAVQKTTEERSNVH